MQSAVLDLRHGQAVSLAQGGIDRFRLSLRLLILLELLQLNHLVLQFEMQSQQLDLLPVVALALFQVVELCFLINATSCRWPHRLIIGEDVRCLTRLGVVTWLDDIGTVLTQTH